MPVGRRRLCIVIWARLHEHVVVVERRRSLRCGRISAVSSSYAVENVSASSSITSVLPTDTQTLDLGHVLLHHMRDWAEPQSHNAISGWDPNIDWDNSLAEVTTLLLLSQQCYDGTIRTISDSPDRALEPIEVFPVNRSRLSHRPSFKRFEHFDQLCARWRSTSALTFIHTWFTMVTQSPGPGSVTSRT